ncbi:MAG: cupredoxin domain-containing protein, partial [Gammaproteobacteria bacterium]
GEIATVRYRDGEFSPKDVQIEAGRTIKFVNESAQPVWPASNIHPTHSIYPEFDSARPVAPQQSWSFTFERPGIWLFHNHFTPEQGGRIRVSGTVAEKQNKRAKLDPHTLTFTPVGQLTEGEARALFRDGRVLERAAMNHGPAHTVAALSQHAEALGEDCHQRAHVLGRLAYSLFGVDAFSFAGHECQSGVYHGTMEALFHEEGTANIQQDVATICSVARNDFFQHQCIHGVGHGLMAWANYEMLDALALCDELESATNRESCYSGVFVENIVGGLVGAMGHKTKYLSDDMHFPCNVLEDRYVPACYYYQSSRMVQLTGGDFRAITQACETAPETAQHHCFLSMGRDVGARTRSDPAAAARQCSWTERGDFFIDCISGAVQDWFWEASGADDALGLCAILQWSPAKRMCYDTITSRAKQILETRAEMQSFCDQVESGYRKEDCATP